MLTKFILWFEQMNLVNMINQFSAQNYQQIASNQITSHHIMLFFETNLSTLEEGSSAVTQKQIEGVPYFLFASRGLGSVPFPIGCSTITTTVHLAAKDEYWFAALFEVHREIEQLDFLKLYLCIAGFLPLFEEQKIVLKSVTIDCFQEGKDYKLALPKCTVGMETVLPR